MVLHRTSDRQNMFDLPSEANRNKCCYQWRDRMMELTSPIVFFDSKPSLSDEMKLLHRLQISHDDLFEKPRGWFTVTSVVMPNTNEIEKTQRCILKKWFFHLANASWINYFDTDMKKTSIDPRWRIFRCGSDKIRTDVWSSSPNRMKWTYDWVPTLRSSTSEDENLIENACVLHKQIKNNFFPTRETNSSIIFSRTYWWPCMFLMTGNDLLHQKI